MYENGDANLPVKGEGKIEVFSDQLSKINTNSKYLYGNGISS
jgi:hypothetical protein